MSRDYTDWYDTGPGSEAFKSAGAKIARYYQRAKTLNKGEVMKPKHIIRETEGDYGLVAGQSLLISDHKILLTFENSNDAEAYADYMHDKGFRRFKHWCRKHYKKTCRPVSEMHYKD